MPSFRGARFKVQALSHPPPTPTLTPPPGFWFPVNLPLPLTPPLPPGF